MHVPAVDVKQNAKPAKQEDATVPSTPVSGRERRRPMVPTALGGGECECRAALGCSRS
jgi:hypothetical protein